MSRSWRATRPRLADAEGQIQRGRQGQGRGDQLRRVENAAPIQAAYDQAMSEFGKIDIFVNNAGQSTRGPSETITDEMWQADLDLKLFAQIRFCRLLFPQMKQRKWGRIISVLNIGAKAPGADSAPTSVSRAAQMAFTKALSIEGAPHNVLVNSLHVGVIVSDQIVRRFDREGPNVSLSNLSPRPAAACRWAAWATPRNSPMSRPFSPPTPPATSPAARSTSMAAARR